MMANESAPSAVLSLAERFDRSGSMGEATLCRDHLDPLFEALGWDLRNEKGCPEPLKQAVFESPVKRHHTTGRADYCFQLFGRPAFFVEAKLPSISDWQLSTEEKKRILLANIHGVDIDAQAVEVTKLSLLLKVLEGEDAESLNTRILDKP